MFEEIKKIFETHKSPSKSEITRPISGLKEFKDLTNRFIDLMVEFNQSWTKNAAALCVVISRETFAHNNKPSPTHSFDTGAAWMALALEGSARGLVVHGMSGFDHKKAKASLNIPEGSVTVTAGGAKLTENVDYTVDYNLY